MSGTTILTNPFPGLRSFQEDEGHLFFGREKQVLELYRKMLSTRFLVVVGTSGSGKSSLVRSGLIPQLAELDSSRANWTKVVFRPGNNPFGNLIASLCKSNLIKANGRLEQSRVAEELLANPHNLSHHIARKKANILLVVDQFEEIFRFPNKGVVNYDLKKYLENFVQLLLTSSRQDDVPIYVVLTMRYDFLGDYTDFEGLPEAINQGTYLVPRMNRDEIRKAIQGPIETFGSAISPVLLTRLLNESDDIPHQLPLLQHALMRTWNYWTENHQERELIDLQHYEAIGTMSSALSIHADEAFAELESAKQKTLCEKVFKRITEKKPDFKGIRRPTSIKRLCEVTGADREQVIEIVEIFRRSGRAFLMPPSDIPLSKNSIVDISHESLMWIWTRLMKWVKEETQAAEVFQRLAESTWLHYKQEAALMMSPELDIALEWRLNNQPNETWAKRYIDGFKMPITLKEVLDYIDSSQEKREEDLRDEQRKRESEILKEKKLREQDRKLHELETKQHEAERRQLEQTRRQQRIYLKYAINVAWILGIAVLVSVALMIKAFQSGERAEEAQKQAILERDRARIAENLALEANTKSYKEKEIAEKAREQAEFQKLNAILSQEDAETSRDMAFKQQEIAESQSLKAQEARQKADFEASIAREAQQRAEFLTQLARSAENQSTASKLLAEAKETAIKSTFKNVSDGESVKMALQAYERNLAANKSLGKDTTMFEPEVLNALQNAFLRFNRDVLHEGSYLASAFRKNRLVFHDGSRQLHVKDLVKQTNSPVPLLYDSRKLSLASFARTIDFFAHPNRVLIGTIDGKLFHLNLVKSDVFTSIQVVKDGPIVAMTTLKDGDLEKVIMASGNNKLSVLDLHDNSVIEYPVDSRINSLIVHGNEVLVGADDDGNLVEWELTSTGLGNARLIYRHLRGGQSVPIRTLTAYGNLIAAGDAQGQIILFRYDGSLMNIKSFLKLHKGFVSELSFNSGGDLLASASLDGSIYLWNLKGGFAALDVGQIPLEIENSRQVHSVAFDDSDQFLIYGDKSKWYIRPIIAANLYEILTGQVTRVAQNQP